jgi:hypothetical protein
MAAESVPDVTKTVGRRLFSTVIIVIQRGAKELNPVMAFFLEHGTSTFIVAKYILTSVGVLILLIFKNVFLTRLKIYTHSLFPCVIFVFITVIAWELFLIYSAP